MSIKYLEESFLFLRKNPILYLPDLVMGVFSSLLLYFVFLYTDAGSLLQLLQTAETSSLDILTGFISENLKEIIISIIVFIFASFILGVSVMIFKFSMIHEMLKGNKISLLNSWKEKRIFR